ncbi:Ketopantoate reductase PanE/ApbA [uncultured archaeon]|nr:Ketopantoate reductase PanE/ApbA [uncultured archaeon]
MVEVLIYGAGAIGSFVGYLLSERAGTERGRSEAIGAESEAEIAADEGIQNVALLGRKGHIERIKASGLRINMSEGPRSIRFQYAFSSLEEAIGSGFHPDLVAVCVKAYSLPSVRAEILNSGALDGCLKSADWSEPLRVDNELSNANSWRESYEKDEAALRSRIQDINSSRA